MNDRSDRGSINGPLYRHLASWHGSSHVTRFWLLLCVTLALVLTACGGRVVIVITATPIPTLPPTQTPTPTPSLTPIPPTVPPTLMPTPASMFLWVAPTIPDDLKSAIGRLPGGRYHLVDNAAHAQVTLDASGSVPAIRWVYVPVVPFASIPDDIKWADVERYWRGDRNALSELTSDNKPPLLIASAPTIQWLITLLGKPSTDVTIELARAGSVPATLWAHRGRAWAIVPFQQLDPSLKALAIDGLSVFDRDLNPDRYALTQRLMVGGDPSFASALASTIEASGLATNRDQSKLTIVVMTGTTTLARATAYTMEQKGITLPGRDIQPFLAGADFVHVSNETPFATDCPPPKFEYTATNLRFCSDDSYLDLLKSIRVNLVELTGNHVNDWGRDALNHTLDLYDANKMVYFGGGRNTDDARKGVIIEHNGNKIAFIGCNAVGPEPAWATDTLPGAATCDDDFLSVEIPRLKSAANVVVMDIQYQEYYQYDVPQDQIDFFSKYEAMGADIILGTQAHQPMGFAIGGTAFIHYGLGNLFFDQMDDMATRQMFMDKLIIYNGRHISTTLFTGIIEDYSRPRPMTPDERAAFLKLIFGDSGW